MIPNSRNPQTALTSLISPEGAENEVIEFETARLDLTNRAVEL